jgi:hypothetical protein
MTDYLMMIAEQDARTAAAAGQRMATHRAYTTRLASAVLDAGLLHARSEGKRVFRDRVEDGAFDGAFDRYYLIRAADADAASALALDAPLADGDRVELRPLLEGRVPPGKLDRPGKVFAFSVNGAAPDEPTWSALMEQIAKDTKDTFSPDQFVGGMRLQPPTTARKIVIDTSKRHLLDGPFVESKEVIGGLFFLRLASIDDAVQWARASAFLARGTLEIRELWRM